MTEDLEPTERTLLDDPRVGEIVADELRQRLRGVPDSVAEPLVAAQLASKLHSLMAQHPDAVVDLVSSDGTPVACMVTDEVDGVIRLCDIAVVAAVRGRGYGHALLVRLLDHADTGAEAVELSVWHGAFAREWYERHGFRAVGGDAHGHIEMRREPAGE